jgi:hypothetical protein
MAIDLSFLLAISPSFFQKSSIHIPEKPNSFSEEKRSINRANFYENQK